MHFHFQPQWYAFVSHNGVQFAKCGPTKAYSASQLLLLILAFCHHLSKVDVAVNFSDLPSIDADVHFVNYRIASDCHCMVISTLPMTQFWSMASSAHQYACMHLTVTVW